MAAQWLLIDDNQHYINLDQAIEIIFKQQNGDVECRIIMSHREIKFTDKTHKELFDSVCGYLDDHPYYD